MRVLPGASGFSHSELSVASLKDVVAAVASVRPSVVYNCAAYNGVDAAESDPSAARLTNAVGAGNVAEACSRFGVRMVHFSTNFVFDGLLDRPYVEPDPATPLGVYGASKLEGEVAVLAALPTALVVRTSALFGHGGSFIKGGSFPERIVRRALAGDRLRVVSDQRVNPTSVVPLAQAVVGLASSSLSGVVHVVSSGCCSWFDFAQAALKACGVGGGRVLVEGILSSESGAAARRPANGCLESTRVAALPDWREGLDEWASSRARLP